MVLAIANEVCSAHGFECITQKGPMLGIVIAQKCFVQPAALFTFDHINLFTVTRNFAQRIFGGVVHGCGGGHGARIEGLNLIGAKTVFLQPDGQVHHVFIAGAWVRCNEVRHQELFLASFCTELVKHALELVVRPNAGLHHFGERA